MMQNMKEMKERKIYRIWSNDLSRFITTGSRIKTHWHTFRAVENAYQTYLNNYPNSDLVVKEYDLVFSKDVDTQRIENITTDERGL